MPKPAKPKVAAKHPAKPATIARRIAAPVCDPVPVFTAAEWIYCRRKAYADLDAKDPPLSYGNGWRDGATLAQDQLLRLAQGYGALTTDLFEYLALEKPAHDRETLYYRKGLLVGYISVFHDYLGPGGPASLSIAYPPGGIASTNGGAHG